MLTQGPELNLKCKLNISSFLTFIRLPHLYQEFYVHCIAITNDGGNGIGGDGSFISRFR